MLDKKFVLYVEYCTKELVLLITGMDVEKVCMQELKHNIVS